MNFLKSAIIAARELSWLFIIVLICAATISASFFVSRPGLSYVRQIAARYL